MTAREALLAIAARVLAQRNGEEVPARPEDLSDKFDNDGPQLFIRSKSKSSRVGK
jgi:hypothetical protein